VGQCRWVYGDEDAIVQGIGKPRFVDMSKMELHKLLKDKPVEIVLFDGYWPGINYPMWTSPDVRYMIWSHPSSNRFVAPKGWLLELVRWPTIN
jgi:hypothetical protein